MGYWSNVSPSGAIRDFAVVWKENPYRWPTLLVAMAISGSMMLMVIPKTERVPERPPEITYISTFAPDRTRAEIYASNIANEKKKEAAAKLDEERDQIRKDAYRALGKATGLDVDRMERDIARDQAAEDQAAAAKRADLLQRQAEARAKQQGGKQ